MKKPGKTFLRFILRHSRCRFTSVMPRANRTILDGRICHITHRCHDRQFLLAEAEDRDEYLDRLGTAAPEFLVDLLGYCITGNHIHLLCIADQAQEISGLMKKVQGEFGQAYNLRNERSGAFWSDRFHCTLVDVGQHLWNCMRYIDLNMVRAGVVQHPREWPWCGYQEICGEKTNLQLINTDRLSELTRPESPEALRDRYRETIEEGLRREKQIRDARWTESVAIGPRGFIDEVGNQIQRRSRWVREEDPLFPGQWSISEPSARYGAEVDFDTGPTNRLTSLGSP